jgi:hypothetical protein
VATSANDPSTLANYAALNNLLGTGTTYQDLLSSLSTSMVNDPNAPVPATAPGYSLTPYYVAGGSEPLNLPTIQGQQYRLIDNVTGQTITPSGTGTDAAGQVAGAISGINKNAGDQANYTIQTMDPLTSSWQTVGGHLPAPKSDDLGLGGIIPFLVAGGALGLGPLGAEAGATGVGDIASSVGDASLVGSGGLDALAAAPLSGAVGTAGAADLAASIAPTLGEAAGAGLGTLASSVGDASLVGSAGADTLAAAPAAVEAAAPEILVNAPAALAAPTASASIGDLLSVAPLSGAAGVTGAQALADTISPAISAAAPSAASSTLANLSKALQAGAAASTVAGLATGAKGSGATSGTIPAGMLSDMTTLPASFTSPLPAPQAMYTAPSAGAGAGAGTAGGAPGVVVPYDATNLGIPSLADVQAAMARGAAGGIAATDPTAVIPAPAQPVKKAHGGLAMYAEGGRAEQPDYDYAAAKAAGIAPDQFGHMPDTYKLPSHMTFSADSIYSTPEHQGGKWTEGNNGSWVFWPSEHNMQQHPMPEMQHYFQTVEQGIPGRPDSYVVFPSGYRLPERKAHGGMTGYAEGGPDSSFAVNGPGTGRSDSIPAKLSDGEYVVDAETVALLGDGSSKAGADALDQMRVNLRKQKGKNLAQGKFSVKARAPEAYMSGGRI